MAQTIAGNGQEAMPQPSPDTAQRLIVNVQYIKDLSFENPRAPQSLTQQPSAPNVDINVDVNAQPLDPETYEVDQR
jgi:preprotein translocase subunit SecB